MFMLTKQLTCINFEKKIFFYENISKKECFCFFLVFLPMKNTLKLV